MNIQEYNGVETFFHATTGYNCEVLASHAREVGRVELIGRPMGDHEEIARGENWNEYAGWGQGVAYALSFDERDNCWEFAGPHGGCMFVLGWDGETSEEAEDEGGEYVVPLSAYKVIAVITLDEKRNEVIHDPMDWAGI